MRVYNNNNSWPNEYVINMREYNTCLRKYVIVMIVCNKYKEVRNKYKRVRNK